MLCVSWDHSIAAATRLCAGCPRNCRLSPTRG